MPHTMEIAMLKKGGKPPMGEDDDASLLEDAIREVAKRIDKYDADSLMGSYNAKMHPAEEIGDGADMTDGPPVMVSKEECPDCAKGECVNPDHMDEGTLRQMLSTMSEKGEE